MARTSRKPSQGSKAAKAYDHTEQPAVLRPDIGLQAQFKQKKEPATYRYDRSLDLLEDDEFAKPVMVYTANLD